MIDFDCSCHISPPCPLCVELTEDEVDVLSSGGPGALRDYRLSKEMEKLETKPGDVITVRELEPEGSGESEQKNDPDLAEAVEDLLDGVDAVVIKKGDWFYVECFHPYQRHGTAECPAFSYAMGKRIDGSPFYVVKSGQQCRYLGKLSEFGGL